MKIRLTHINLIDPILSVKKERPTLRNWIEFFRYTEYMDTLVQRSELDLIMVLLVISECVLLQPILSLLKGTSMGVPCGSYEGEMQLQPPAFILSGEILLASLDPVQIHHDLKGF